MNNNTLYNLRKEIFNNKRFDNITSIPGYNFINYNDSIKSNFYINNNDNVINDSFYFKININKNKNIKFNKTRKKK